MSQSLTSSDKSVKFKDKKEILFICNFCVQFFWSVTFRKIHIGLEILSRNWSQRNWILTHKVQNSLLSYKRSSQPQKTSLTWQIFFQNAESFTTWHYNVIPKKWYNSTKRIGLDLSQNLTNISVKNTRKCIENLLFIMHWGGFNQSWCLLIVIGKHTQWGFRFKLPSCLVVSDRFLLSFCGLRIHLLREQRGEAIYLKLKRRPWRPISHFKVALASLYQL